MMCARMIMIHSAYDVFIPHRTRSRKKTGHLRTSTLSTRGPWSGCILRQVFLTQAAWSGCILRRVFLTQAAWSGCILRLNEMLHN